VQGLYSHSTSWTIYYVVHVFLFSSFVGLELIFEHCSFLMSVHQMEIVALVSTVFLVRWGFQALGVLDQLPQINSSS